MTLCFISSHDLNITINELNSAASKFNVWCKCNKLTINLKKSKAMTFGRSSVAEEVRLTHSIIVDTVSLEWVSVYKYLGIILDESLSFQKHIA